MNSRVSIQDIAQDLAIGRHSVYQMLEAGVIPGIKLGRGWLVTRNAYERWKQTCGTETLRPGILSGTDLRAA